MERRLGLAFTTLTIFAPLAQASHSAPAPEPESTASTASPRAFVATPVGPRGFALARQVLPPSRASPIPAHAAPGDDPPRAQSRVLYLNRDGGWLRPGDNDAGRHVSSVVGEPTAIAGWDVDDDTWRETVACVAELYARFDVTVTDEDPGDVPHIAAMFGGHPSDVGLPDDVAGVSPFTTDCAIIERSIVFTFTDVLPEDPRTICEVTAQEIAHSFGLDHEMLASDPMTYLDHDGDREFQDRSAACGELESRPCGAGGSVCRQRQNSVQLLAQRLGLRREAESGAGTDGTGTRLAGCSTGAGGSGLAMALAIAGTCRRRRSRRGSAADAARGAPRAGPQDGAA